MTSVLDDQRSDVHVAELPWGGSPYREVVGESVYPSDLDPDGDPLTMLLDSPEDPAAVALCGGEVRWWSVCQAIRMASTPGAWAPPDGITITQSPDGVWLVCTTVGEMLVQRTATPD